jgi:hypothetical protein
MGCRNIYHVQTLLHTLRRCRDCHCHGQRQQRIRHNQYALSNATYVFVLPLQNYFSSSSSSHKDDNNLSVQQHQGQYHTSNEGRTKIEPSQLPEQQQNSSSPIVAKMPWSMDWRKIQLDNLEAKHSTDSTVSIMKNVSQDDELQDTWKQMESRVKNRKSSRSIPSGRSSGRMNVQKTDEDIWLQHGFYDTQEIDINDDKNTNSSK